MRQMGEPVPAPSDDALPEGADSAAEAERIPAAAREVAAELRRSAGRAAGEGAEILAATAQMAEDPALLQAAQELVRTRRTPAPRALWAAAEQIAGSLEALGGPFAERAADVRDVRDRLLAALRGDRPPGIPTAAEPFVLIAQDLAPADTAGLDPAQVLALVTVVGGPQSHTAILARRLGLPAIVGAAGAREIPDGTAVLVDADEGWVSDESTAQPRALRTSAPPYSGGGAVLADGTRVPLLANVGSVQDAEAAAAAHADGIGLLRTEFLFQDRTREPSIPEQVRAYREIFAQFPDRPVVVRTLDAGADKPLPFLPVPAEPNPDLGMRGYRMAQLHPGVLDRQLAAIARAAQGAAAQVQVIAPMITTLAETEEFVARSRAVGIERVGIMIETPAAALTSAQLLAACDVASIGTNDLTQYTMAADRRISGLAELGSVAQPAVLALIAAACEGAAVAGTPIGVCGEAAADPELAGLLVGLGATSLSMTPRAIPAVAAALAGQTRQQARDRVHSDL